MTPAELIQKAKSIVAERWSNQVGYGVYSEECCAVGALIEAARDAPLTTKVNDQRNSPRQVVYDAAFNKSLDLIYSCIKNDLDETTGVAQCDIEDWNDAQGSSEPVVAAFDCALAKAAA